jgi:hypothetical protein
MPTLCAMIAADEPSKLRGVRPDVPEELEAVVLRCLEKQPANRFGSVADFGRALLPFAGQDGLAAVARIARIAAGTEATAASAVKSARPIPRVPPPHEATAASALALPDKETPSPVPPRTKRRWALVVAPLFVAAIAVPLAVVRVVGTSHAPASLEDRPRPPPPLPSELVANGSPAPIEPRRTESQPSPPPPDAPDAGARVDPPAQAMTKTKPRAIPPSPASAVPPLMTEKLPLDPLIDQR